MLREKALEVAIDHIRYEDENSRYLGIGNVEKVKLIFGAGIIKYELKISL